MGNLYLIFSIIVAIVSIVTLVKFFQIASDIRAMRRYFVKEQPGPAIRQDERITGAIRGSGITYVVVNGSTRFSDGKTGYIKYLPDGQCSISIDGKDVVFADVYYAAEALYQTLATAK